MSMHRMGHCAIVDQRSLHVLYLVYPLKRDGTILRRGHLVSWYARRIARVCRSTANAECIALNGAVDVTVYLQVIIGELLTGIYDVQFLLAGEVIPLLNPFRRPPAIESIKEESVNVARSQGIDSFVIVFFS